MENDNLNKKADRILQIIKDGKKNLGGIKDYVKKEMTANEVDSIIKTLEADKYIETTNDRGIFKTTTLGDDFKGYRNQQSFTVSENIRLVELESATTANRLLTTHLTILIAAGTLVAAIYYGIEIYKEFHSFFHRHELYWIWETIPKKP